MYLIPNDLNDVKEQSGITYIAGGTDIMPLLKNNVRDDENIVFTGKLPELRGITQQDGYIYIGAGETLWDIARSDIVQAQLPAVAQAAEATASPQIRNIATLGGNVMQDRRCIYFNQPLHWRKGLAFCFKTGGNICHQIPNSPVCRALYYSDTATALVLYEAEAEYLENGERSWVSVADLIARHSEANGLSCHEHLPILVLRFRAKSSAGEQSGFYKYTMRATIDFPIFNAALRCGGDRPAGIVVGAVAPFPVVLQETAKLLEHPEISDDDVVAAAKQELKKLAMPIKEACIPPAQKQMLYNQLSLLMHLRRASER